MYTLNVARVEGRLQVRLEKDQMFAGKPFNSVPVKTVFVEDEKQALATVGVMEKVLLSKKQQVALIGGAARLVAGLSVEVKE